MDKLFRIRTLGLIPCIFIGLFIMLAVVIFVPIPNALWWKIALTAAIALAILLTLSSHYSITEDGNFTFYTQKSTLSSSKIKVHGTNMVSVQWCDSKQSKIFLLEYKKSGKSEFASLHPQKPELLIAALKELNSDIKVTELQSAN